MIISLFTIIIVAIPAFTSEFLFYFQQQEQEEEE
jgi:hypothetical protein